MPNYNRVLLIGHVGRDPEVRFTPGGSPVANFSMATTERWTKDGKKNERTDWHNIVAWGKTAEICGESVKKGDPVLVEGRLQSRDWQDKNGNKRTTVEVNADRVHMLGQKRAATPAPVSSPGPASGADDDDDIQF